jgi:hypothetical protein
MYLRAKLFYGGPQFFLRGYLYKHIYRNIDAAKGTAMSGRTAKGLMHATEQYA